MPPWNPRLMQRVSPKRMAAAVRKHEALSSQALYARCDELAVLQKTMFMELVSFARDGATDGQITELIGFLSIMQYLAEDFSTDAAMPVRMPEFSAAVERAVLWLKTLETYDPHDRDRMTMAWLDGMQQRGEPVIWAWLVNVLKRHDILNCPLVTGMVVTLYAVAEVYSDRIASSA